MKPRLAMMCVLTLSVMLFGPFAFAQEPPPPQAQEPQGCCGHQVYEVQGGVPNDRAYGHALPTLANSR